MSLSFVEQTTPGATSDWFLNDLCWCPGISKFVGVGKTGNLSLNVITSSDGITWAFQTVPETENWQSVAYAPAASGLGSGSGRIVAVASTTGAHQVMYSDNSGVTWTTASAALAQAWRSVTWSSTLNLFCAVASDGIVSREVMTSPDGINWTIRTAAANKSWSQVLWADGRFIAVGNTRSTTSVMTSTDGVNWSSLTTPVSVNTFFGNGRQIAYSAALGMWAFTCRDASNVFHVLTSTDHGTTWVDQTLPVEVQPAGEGLWSIAWSPELTTWLVLTDNPGAISSPDGVNWTFSDLSGLDPTASWLQIAYSPSLQVFVGWNPPAVNILYVSGAAPLTPTSGPAVGGTSIAVNGDGATNGGFTRTGADVQVSIGVGLEAIFGVSLTSWQTAVIPDIFFTPYGQCSSVVVTDSAHLTAVTTHGKSAGNDVLIWDNNNSLGGANVLFWSPAAYTYISPVVTSASPTHGIQGATITLTGTNLFRGDVPLFGINDPGTVTFDGVAATNVTYVNTTTLTCLAPAHISGHNGIIDIVYSPPHLTVTFGLGGYFTYSDSTLAAYFTYDNTWLNLPGGVYVDSAVLSGEGALVGSEADVAGTGFFVFFPDGADGGGVKFGGSTEMDILVASVPTAQRGGQWELNAFNFKGRLEEVG